MLGGAPIPCWASCSPAQVYLARSLPRPVAAAAAATAAASKEEEGTEGPGPLARAAAAAEAAAEEAALGALVGVQSVNGLECKLCSAQQKVKKVGRAGG